MVEVAAAPSALEPCVHGLHKALGALGTLVSPTSCLVSWSYPESPEPSLGKKVRICLCIRVVTEDRGWEDSGLIIEILLLSLSF